MFDKIRPLAKNCVFTLHDFILFSDFIDLFTIFLALKITSGATPERNKERERQKREKKIIRPLKIALLPHALHSIIS